MNKNKVLLICSVFVVALAVGYGTYRKPETSPAVEDLNQISRVDETQSTETQKTLVTTAVTATSLPSGWKIFKGHGVSIAAPSNFIVSRDTENNGNISFGVNSPSSGSILIEKSPDKASYDKFISVMDTMKPYITTTLVTDTYTVNGEAGQLYTIKLGDEGITSNMILLPNKLTYISVTPAMDQWKGYSESQVRTMIQSINLETGETGHVSISYQRALANLVKTQEKLSKLNQLGEIQISQYSNEGHSPEVDKVEPIMFSVGGRLYKDGSIIFSFDNCKKDQTQDDILKSYFTGTKTVTIQLPKVLQTYRYSSESYDNSNEFFFDAKNSIIVKDSNGTVLKEFTDLASRCSTAYYQVWLPQDY